jgi:outer membrane protein assembly factor BamE (lipoprotein component of BamABCDE complex)
MLKTLAAVALVSLICGCATRSSMNQLSVGMTKEQVLDILGTPHTKEAHNDVEVLDYTLGDPSPFSTHTTYYVELRNSKVTSFGERDDYDPNK